jgi:3-methyl-2-oxobutanoate hydroxymethyltransferase
VLEGVPSELGTQITQTLQIPTIGIGAGPGTDGQVLVVNDLLGLSERLPRFAKAYADLRAAIGEAARAFAEDVASGAFPDEAHSYRA